MIARITQFCVRNYVAWSAFKLGAFVGAIGGMIFMAALMAAMMHGFTPPGLGRP